MGATETELIVRIASGGAGQTVRDVLGVQKAIAQLGKDSKDTAALAKQLGSAYNLPDDQVRALADALGQAKAATEGAADAAGTYRDAMGKLRDANGRFVKDGVDGFNKLGATGSGVAGSLDSVFRGFFEGIGRKGLDVAVQSVQALGGAIKDTVGEALNQSAAFDEARAAASTLTDDTDGLIAALEQAQGRLGNQVSTTELLAASYDILSSGFTDSADAAAIAEAAARGALAGFSDTDTTADALTTIINSYGQMGVTAGDAEQIIDQLVKTQDLGKVTLGEYADQLGRAASVAALAGVSFVEFSGAIATATAKGVPAESAVSGTRQAIVNLLKPTSQAAALLKEFGINNASAALKSGGLVGVLETLKDQGATTEQLSLIFSDVDALATVATLAGENLGTFQANIEGIAGSTGATDKNIRLLTESIEGQKQALKVLTEEGFTKLGQAIDPIRLGILTFASDLITATTEGSDGLGELSAAAERFRVVLSENPEIAQQLGDALATVADAGVKQISLLIDAITAFVSEQKNIDAIADNIESLATVITTAGQTARFIVAISEALLQLQGRVEGIPVIGDVLDFSNLNPIANLQGIIDTFTKLKNAISNTAEFVANLVSRFDVLANNPVIKALVGQILATEAATSNLGDTIGSGLKGAVDSLGQAGNQVAATLTKAQQAAAGTGNGVVVEVEKIEDALKRLGDANKTATDDLSTDAANTRAAILEAGGDPAKLAALEAQTLRDRIQNNRDFLKELTALQSGGGLSVEDAAAVADQIRGVEGQLASDRVSLAQQTLAEKQRTEKAAADAAKAAAEAKAKAETDALKKTRDEEKRLADQAQADREKAAQREFDDSRDGRAETRDAQRRAEDKALQEALQADDRQFQNERRESDRAFQQQQQTAAEAFQQSQQAAAEAFQRRLDAERDQGGREFDVLGSEVDKRLQLAQADSTQRAELLKQFEEERKTLELRRQIEKEVLGQKGQVLSENQGALELSPLEAARAAFEEQLQAKQKAFQESQQAAAQAFQESQALADQERSDAQRIEDEKRADDRQAADEERDAARQKADAEFEDNERKLQDNFELQQRNQKEAFNAQQRQLDEASAQRIAAILAAAKPRGIDGARRDGGPVKAGGSYLVGEEGPEIVTMRRGGYVHTARETAAMMAGVSGRGGVTVAQPSTGAVEAKLDRLISVVESGRKVQAGPTSFVLQSDNPVADAVGLQLEQIRQMVRGGGL